MSDIFPNIFLSTWVIHNDAVKTFKNTGCKGVHITFKNGFTVSVQWGPANYGDNYYEPIESIQPVSEDDYRYSSSTAEVAVWDATCRWVTSLFCPKAHDGVAGYLTFGEVSEMLKRVAGWQDTPENKRRLAQKRRQYTRAQNKFRRMVEEYNKEKDGLIKEEQ